MTTNRNPEQPRRGRPREELSRTQFHKGVLRASTPNLTAENSFKDPFDRSFFEFDQFLKTQHCPRTYSRPKQQNSPDVDQLSDCSISLADVSVESMQTLHSKAEKAGRFRNIRRLFSLSNRSPEEPANEDEKPPSDWLLFQSPKKPLRSEMNGPKPKKVRRISVYTSVSKKFPRRGHTPKKTKGVRNKMARGRLPVKIKLPKIPVMTGEQIRQTDVDNTNFGSDESD